MKKNLLLFLSFLFAVSICSAQNCFNNPSIQQGDINPAPLTGNAGGTISFSFTENLLDYTDDENDPVKISLCLLNIEPVNGASSVGGSFSSTFTWVYSTASNCLQGTQNQDIIGGTGGPITVVFNQIPPGVPCPSNQTGFNANIQPAACMNGVNETVDDTESSYTCVISLPIELSDFTGISQECKGFLNWTTLSETDFSHFELESSEDGEHFQTIATIQGKGSENSTASYSYIDLRLNETNFYRLKSVDIDGTVEYSKIIYLEKDCSKGETALEVFPNPSYDNTVSLQLTSINETENIRIKIFDVLGRTVMVLPVRVEKGVNLYKVDLDGLANATYFIRLDGKDMFTESKKFIKLSE